MQALRILNLFQEKLILRHVMKVPPHLRLTNAFEQAYSSLVKALVPVRGQIGGVCAARAIPATAPQQRSMMRRSTVGGQEVCGMQGGLNIV